MLSFDAQKRRGDLNRRNVLASVLVLVGWVLVTLWLLVIAWRRATGDFDSHKETQSAPNYPMKLGSLIEGTSSGQAGELVYLTEVLLKPGPAPKTFFLSGHQGTRILTVADGAHLLAAAGDTVDVKGTIRITPPIDVLRRQWKLSRTEASQVSQVPIYIESTSIRKSGD